jgi:hypothetical protein
VVVTPRFAPDRSEFQACRCGRGEDGERFACTGCLEFAAAHDEWCDRRDRDRDACEAADDARMGQMKDEDIRRG